MTTIPLTEAKAKLNELVDQATTTHERITLTKRGRPAAVLISVDDLASIEETLFWLSEPEGREALAQARREYEAGDVLDEDAVRARYGLSKRR